MIAISKNRCVPKAARCPNFEDELPPAIQSQARLAFRHVNPSGREELIAETVANAFVAYRRLVERDKADIIYATPLAQHAIRQVRSGRRVGAKLNKNDVTSAYCQRSRRMRLERLDRREDVQGGSWKEVVVEDRTAGPAEIAATRIDFSQWLARLPSRRRRIAKTLAKGESTSAAAKRFSVSPARISQLRRELHETWKVFQSDDEIVRTA